MKIIFRKPIQSDRNKINRFLIILKYDYIPLFSDKERKEELDKIYTRKANAILALTQKGQIVGYMVWELYSRNKKYSYIANVGVHPRYRRKGISIKLRRRVFNQMKKAGFKGVYYTTWHKNVGMIKSSEKLGMKIAKVYLDEKFRGPKGKTIIFRKDF